MLSFEKVEEMAVEQLLSQDTLGVISRVVGKWRANPDLFKMKDLSNWPMPRIE